MSLRCTGRTKHKKRCSKRTRRGDLCWIHLKSTLGLGIKQSRIPGAGLGLVTYKDIKADSHIVNYGGKIVTSNPKNNYTIQLGKNKYLDGSKPTSSFGRFANTCRAQNRPHCTGNNARFAIDNRNNRARIKAQKNRAIKVPTSGPKKDRTTEIFVAYGSSFKLPASSNTKTVKRTNVKRIRKSPKRTTKRTKNRVLTSLSSSRTRTIPTPVIPKLPQKSIPVQKQKQKQKQIKKAIQNKKRKVKRKTQFVMCGGCGKVMKKNRAKKHVATKHKHRNVRIHAYVPSPIPE
jgi:hypothetical protein